MNCFQIALTIAALMLAFGCQPAKKDAAAPSSPPAKIKTENDLASIVLTPQAEQRLGIETAPIEIRKVARNRTLGGEMILPLGRQTEATNSSRSIYSLLPAMTPTELVRVAELQVQTDGQIAAAEVEVKSAKVALARAESLIANKSGTQRAVDEARAQLELAEAARANARERRALLGAPLFDAVKSDRLWVRVPIYAGDVGRINQALPANVTSLGAHTNQSPRTAKPISVPFSTSAGSATVDLFYELETSDSDLRPGQKVRVSIPLQGEQESLVAPVAAILYDIHGGTWVYENSVPQTFTRRRVAVRWVSNGGAVLASGPQAGVKVVTAGAAELFGTEFGIGK